MTRKRHIKRIVLLVLGIGLSLVTASPAGAARDFSSRHPATSTPIRVFPGLTGRMVRFNEAPGKNLTWQVLLGRGRALLGPWSPRRILEPSSNAGSGILGGAGGVWMNERSLTTLPEHGSKRTSDLLGRWSDILRTFRVAGSGLHHGWLGRVNVHLSTELEPLFTQGPPATEDLDCLADLIEAGLDFQVGPASPGIKTPVTVTTWNLGGVRYVPYYPDQHLTQMDCRLVRTLVRAGPVLRSVGVREVVWSSAYRPPDRAQILGAKPYNKHTEGLAIDIHAFRFGGKIQADVARNYEKGLGFQRDASCLGRPDTQEGFLLRLVACRLDASDLFQEILTPDYDSDHWNHFHLAVFRPKETRRHKRTALLEVPLEKIPGWALTRLGHARPDLEIWKDVARLPWPKGYGRLAARVLAPDRSSATAALSLAKVGRYLTRLALPSLARRKQAAVQ